MTKQPWLNKEFYSRMCISELFDWLRKNTNIRDILICEYGRYSALDEAEKLRVGYKHIETLSPYDDEWVYAELGLK